MIIPSARWAIRKETTRAILMMKRNGYTLILKEWEYRRKAQPGAGGTSGDQRSPRDHSKSVARRRGKGCLFSAGAH